MEKFVVVIGPAAHGKSTFRTAFAEALHVEGGSCSDYIYAVWAYLGDTTVEALRKLPKEDIRPKLVALGDWLTTPAHTFRGHFPFRLFPGWNPEALDKTGLPKPHPGALVQGAFNSGVRVLDGVRRRCELEASLPYFAWFNTKPLVVWVEDPRKARNPADNLDLNMDDAHRIVINKGSVEDLQEEARRLAQEIFGGSLS